MNRIVDIIKSFCIKNWKPIIMPSAVLLAICVVITAALGFTNKLTAPKIAVLEKQSQEETMRKIIKADSYPAKILEKEEAAVTYYEAMTDSETVGYIFITSAKGYGGDVSVMTAVLPDGKVHGVDILDASNETPGLGQNVTKEAFYGRYAGLSGELTVVKNGADKSLGQVDAVTGATISSRAVTKAVNEALGYYKVIGEEAEKNEK